MGRDIRERKCVFSIFLPFWVQPTRLVSPVGPSTEKTAAGRSRKTTWILKAQRAIVKARAPPLACPILMSLITSTGETTRFGLELNEVGTNLSTFHGTTKFDGSWYDGQPDNSDNSE